jgi:hypothetical protein
MSRARAGICGLALALAIFTAFAAPAASEVTKPGSKARELAAEVCEDMVGDAAVSAAGEALLAPQQGAWAGTRYSCTYGFDGGSLALRVDVFKSVTAAKQGFAKVRDATTGRTRLYGIGQQGFQAKDLVLVSRKDNFVLTVDPTALPARLNRDAITWASTRAVFDCW